MAKARKGPKTKSATTTSRGTRNSVGVTMERIEEGALLKKSLQIQAPKICLFLDVAQYFGL
ncbi:hypothetical protein RJ641_003940 [Dillenia turbinata]|uniref:Uncharacterized protein n=1 Tax=Dillenia turbinata TaxID=194707 RepID=A0AAN8VHF7_9MAGN